MPFHFIKSCDPAVGWANRLFSSIHIAVLSELQALSYFLEAEKSKYDLIITVFNGN